jgi:nucleoside-diphosphate-sugar epimerase
MNILITGGAGYVGSVLAERLLKKGFKVTILDNFMYGYESILHLVQNKNLNIVKKDIRNIDINDLKNFDVVFHLAAISGAPACASNPHVAQMINVEGTRRLVNFMRGSEQLLIYASTTSFYGKSGIDCDEETKIEPISVYGQTKYEAEKIVMDRNNSIALRFATIFGVSPRMRTDLLVNDFVYRAINERAVVIFNEKSRRTFMHIEDAVDSYIFAMNNYKVMVNNVYNVGDESLNLTKMEIAHAIKKFVDFEIIKAKASDSDLRNFNVHFDKIKKLGYSVKHSLEEGIQELVKLYKFYKPHVSSNLL